MPVPPTAKIDPPVEQDNLDDLGYEKAPEEKKEIPAPKAEEKKADEAGAEKVATGYGKEDPQATVVPPVEAAPPVEKKPEEMTEEEKAAKEITDTIKDLGDGYDKTKISKFALENKLSKEQLAAYVKLTKEEDAAFIKSQETAKLTQRKAWKEELSKDPEFGGEHFDKNVDRVEKLLNSMPNTKKVLTEKGSMLPPYLMKDFLALAKALNPTTSLVTGEAPAPAEDDGNFLDDLYK